MNARTIILTLCLAGGLLSAGCGPGAGLLVRPVPVDRELEETVIRRDPGLFVTDKIAIVDVDGLLMNARDDGLFGTGDNPVSLFIEKLDKAEADPNVKAIVLRINSPGGGVTAGDIMHHRLLTLRRRRGLPVIAAIEDVGASGGYYVACGADRILVHPTSVTGSIGVIVQLFSIHGTLQWMRIDTKAITSGKYKDLASPLKPLSDEDVAILRGMVEEFYERFVAVVDAGRPGLSAEQVRELADGRIFTGTEAVDNGLADAVGYVPDAVAAAKKAAGVSRARIVMYHRPLGYRANAYSHTPIGAAGDVNLLKLDLPEAARSVRPEFLYLWTGRAAGS